MIDASARIDPRARLAEGVDVGPGCLIGADVEIDGDTRIAPYVIIHGSTRIGRRNQIHPFCVIGGDPQDKKYQGEGSTRLEIGDDNTIREHCTINRGTVQGGGVTRIGDHNWVMANVHIAHDCQVGSHTVFANNTALAGHVAIEDHVILGGFTGVHQFCRVGAYSFAAIASVIVKDVPPYLMVAGNTAETRGLNREGLKRHGFSAETLQLLRQAYKILYRQHLPLSEAVEQLKALNGGSAEVRRLVDFVSRSTRGIVR
ncbi:MAG TPA: acyl-ACP--UDP-N-acetylglucosamine O-acyltransferase [Gammaproteobacteria bacterium]|nr:acyl-ACP--UDP-N-acetylglucosamine O-acyltransferase [Gammaproteobacteria bacterium]